MRAAALAVLLIALSSPAHAALLARDGTAKASIVLAANATPPEKTAAEELARYLEKISGARFTVRTEAQPEPKGAVVYVGPTRLARRLGLSAGRMASEEWAVRASGNNVVLAGGRPRGTLYAVYHFLEDDLGVRWWNAFEESVPRQRSLRIGSIARRGRPAFEQRDFTSADGTAEFLVRNRVNGAMTRISWAYGGSEAFATPWFVHSFYYVFPPKEFFESHPEYFSEREGHRTADEAQLCLTNSELPELIAKKLGVYATEAESRAKASGAPLARLLDFSQNDWGGRCKCAACTAAVARDGSEAGPLLTLMNDVSDRIARDHPDALLTTLAYLYTFPPPTAVTANGRVIVRLAGFGKRDFAKGVLAPENTAYRQAIEGWHRVAPRLWIWDYAVAFFDEERTLPIPSYRYYAEDLRYYRDHGVSGIFVQHEFPIGADLRDLKLWMYVKLMEDPALDPRALLLNFTDGYYGPAAAAVRDYLAILEAAIDAKPGYIGVDSDESAYHYIDGEFVVRAERAFDRAEALVRRDPVYVRRVRHARLTVDYAFLRLGRTKDIQRAAKRLGVSPPDRREVAERYLQTWKEQIDLRAEATTKDALRAEVEDEVAAFLDESP